MNDKRNYAALKRTHVIEVAGGEIEIPKTGSISLIEDLTSSTVLSPFVKRLGDLQVAGGKIDGATIRAELAEVAQENGLSGAGLVTALPSILRGFIDKLIVDRAIVESEDHRETLRDWVGTFNEQDLFVCIGGYLKVNLPTAYGPFARAGEALLVQRAPNSASVESGASSTNAESEVAKAG